MMRWLRSCRGSSIVPDRCTSVHTYPLERRPKHFFRIRQPIQILACKPKFDCAAQHPAIDGNVSFNPEFALLLYTDVFDVDLRIVPRKSERTFVQVQTFERLLLGKLRELIQKWNIVDSPVINAQRAFAG